MFRPLRSKRPQRQAIAQTTTRIAPVKGWNAKAPEASMPQGFAARLDNWFPTPSDVRMRKGAEDHVTGFGTPVKTLMAWEGADQASKMFAATNIGIFDVTAPGPVGMAVSALSEGSCFYTQVNTAGGAFLFVGNNADKLRHYNGSEWTQIDAFPVAGSDVPLQTQLIANINSFKRMLFFIERNSMNFYYLPAGQINGTVSKFPLGALFTKGGKLVAMGTWTMDGGTGVDDMAVFATDQGQLAIYQGTNPSNAAQWSLVGIYDLAPPLGIRCFQKFGGDLIYLSSSGAFPLSKVLQSTNVDSSFALSDNIVGEFSYYANLHQANKGWQAINYLRENLLLINVPTTEFSGAMQFVMNTSTGAWAKVTGWNATCFEICNKKLYMGMGDRVARAWHGASDFGNNIVAVAQDGYSYFGGPGTKSFKLIRPVLKILGGAVVQVGLAVDFSAGETYGGAVSAGVPSEGWDFEIWDQGLWDTEVAAHLVWVDPGAVDGYAAAIRLRVSAKDSIVSWSSTDFVIEKGGIL